MSESQAARAAIGSLPPNPPQPVETEQAGQQTPEVGQNPETWPEGKNPLLAESATAPTASEGVDFGAEAAALDPFAFIGSIKSLVSLGTKVLGLVARFPGPQQATAQEVLKVLNEVNNVLNRLPI